MKWWIEKRKAPPGLSKTGAPLEEGLAGASPSGAESNMLDEAFPVNAEERIDEEITENRKAHELLSREPVKIRLGELEGLSGKELRDKAEGIYRGLSTATNKIDGKTVRFVRGGFREMRAHSADERVMKIVPDLKALFEEAVPLWQEKDDGTHPGIVMWHNYGVRATLGGEDIIVRLIAREIKGGILELHHFDADIRETEKAEKAFGGGVGSLVPNQALPTGTTPSKDRLLNWLASVKKEPENASLYDWEDVSKKMKRTPAPGSASVPSGLGVGEAPSRAEGNVRLTSPVAPGQYLLALTGRYGTLAVPRINSKPEATVMAMRVFDLQETGPGERPCGDAWARRL